MRPRTLDEITITTVWPYQGAKQVSDKDARIRDLEEAVRVLGAECRVQRSYDDDPDRSDLPDLDAAKAATDSNPIAAEACKEKA